MHESRRGRIDFLHEHTKGERAGEREHDRRTKEGRDMEREEKEGVMKEAVRRGRRDSARSHT